MAVNKNLLQKYIYAKCDVFGLVMLVCVCVCICAYARIQNVIMNVLSLKIVHFSHDKISRKKKREKIMQILQRKQMTTSEKKRKKNIWKNEE